MERRKLGRTGVQVGVVGMGTWRTFDVPEGDEKAIAERQSIVDEAIGSGVNFFDSSPMYGNAEVVLGRTLASHRTESYVATKVWASSFDAGQAQIRNALGFYGGRVDVYQIHNLVLWRQYLPYLQNLKREGTVKMVGITHYARSAFPEMVDIMEREDIDAIQIPYNAADDGAKEQLLPLSQDRGLGVIVMSPLGTGQLLASPPSPKELAPLQDFGIHTWAQALLKWVVSDVRVHVVIPATSRLGRMRENAVAGAPPFFGDDERERISWLAVRARNS